MSDPPNEGLIAVFFVAFLMFMACAVAFKFRKRCQECERSVERQQRRALLSL